MTHIADIFEKPTVFSSVISIKRLINLVYLFIFICFAVIPAGIGVGAGAGNPHNRFMQNSFSLIPSDAQKETPYEVFGFAPYWVFDGRLENIDFTLLTTLAYFGIPVDSRGYLDKSDKGYSVFVSSEATNLFRKAHGSGTKVVLTLTQMDNRTIEEFLDDEEAWKNMTAQAIWTVMKRGLDGINIDFEYLGDPGDAYRLKFNKFVEFFTASMHRYVPESKITVSVYASSVKEPKLYDITSLASSTDGIFMMAYDFATTGSERAMPTAPLYGYKEGKYWYDVSTAVDDFLKYMPADKLILGLPWYGYNYAVVEPEVNAPTNKGYYVNTPAGRRNTSYFVPLKNAVQTYSAVRDYITPDKDGISNYQSGWDQEGSVEWRSYYSVNDGTWRIVFLETPKSLGLKYDFAKGKHLAGVGVWALGFEDGSRELWDIIAEKFGNKIVDNSIVRKEINENI